MVGLRIADKRIRIEMPEKFLHDNFYIFLDEDENDSWDFFWYVKYKDEYNEAYDRLEGGSSSELRRLIVSPDNETIIYEFYEENAIPERIVATNRCKEALFLLDERYRNPDQDDLERIKVCLFNTFREVFFLGLGYMGIYTVHSASVIADNKAYLFSTFSGGGKSTHSNMWIEYFNADVLNGDVAVLDIDEKGYLYAYGLPWCGTSNLFVNKKALVGGIAFIEQEKYNEIEQIYKDDAALSLYFNCFTPMLTEELVDNMIDFVHKAINKTSVYRLKCLPNIDAAKLSYGKMTQKGLDG